MDEVRPEFSRRVEVNKIGTTASAAAIEATPAERAALAARFDLPEIPSLRADVTLRRVGDGGLARVTGHLSAEVVQTCVISLEPFAARVEEDFELLFGGEAGQEEAEVVIEMGEEEPPEPIRGGAIDIGEAVAEQLALALDPFPRKPGVAFDGYSVGGAPEQDAERPNPFAKLAQLKRRGG